MFTRGVLLLHVSVREVQLFYSKCDSDYFSDLTHPQSSLLRNLKYAVDDGKE